MFLSRDVGGRVGLGLLDPGLIHMNACLWGVWVGEDTARTLRTTQWTRASTRSHQIDSVPFLGVPSGRGVTCYVYQ